MPHATMKLIPGIDTNETPTLNQAAFSQSQLVRFIPDRNNMGLVQKLGGWQSWTSATFTSKTGSGNVTELHAWEDLNSNARLSIGTTTGLYWISQSVKNTVYNITPQTTSGDSIATSSQTVTINISSSLFTVAATPIRGTPVTFTVSTGGTQPTGISLGVVYYVIYVSATTFQIASAPSGTAITLSGTQSGTQTVSIPIASTNTGTNANGSTTVTIYDTGTGVQSVSFANSIVTIGTAASGAAGIAPVAGNQVIFTGSSLPVALSPNTAYYVINPTVTTYQISATSGGSAISFAAGSGTQYSSTPTLQFIQTGYNVDIQTPISISNLFISGVYTVTSTPVAGSYFNIYTISVPGTVNTTTATATLPTFNTSSGFNTITVTEYNHPYITGSTATFLTPTAVNGLTVYGNYIVTLDTSNPTFKYTMVGSAAANASSTVTMNNGYAHFVYYFNIPSLFSSSGYGTGGYGLGGYGVGTALSISQTNTITTTDWSINNFGEILIANPQKGPIYYWSPTNNTTTSYLLPNAPTQNQGIFVAMPARQVVAYGSTVNGIQDPLLVRWSDAADATTWVAAANNQAGSYRIPEGSTIVGAIQAPQQALIFTDLAAWAMQYVGLPYIYGFNKIADGTGLIAKKAVGLMNGVTFWMSQQKFMMLTGSGVQVIPCPVWDKVFQNINTNNYSLIRCATNSTFGEVAWYYPSTNATYNDSYVKYNINTLQWDYGTLDRTAWTDQSVLGTPIGADSAGVIYQHELGYNAGTSPMVSSFQTGYIQLNEADSMIFVDQIWPDFKFTTGNGGTGGITTPATLYVTFYGANYPGDTPTVYGPYTVTASVVNGQVVSTEYISTRIRNRLLSIAVSTANSSGVAASNIFFRIGALRYRYQLDGKF